MFLPMPHDDTIPSAPSWDALYGTAEALAGYFTTAHAAKAGYSPQLLHKYLAKGRIARVRRGIYRLVHFPTSEHEELVVPWLWADQEGVFSHETALTLHDLSDLLPAHVHMTLPKSWQRRRLRVPKGLVLSFAQIDDIDLHWFGPVPITSPRRTLRDCIDVYVSPEFVEQGILQARARGLISADEERKLSVLLEVALEERSS